MDTDQGDQENEVKPIQETVPKGRVKKEKAPLPAPGDLVFAKVESPDATELKVAKGKYPVFFFGTYEMAVLGPKEIVPFEPNKAKYGKGKQKQFVIGMKEIQETPHILCGPQLVISQTVPITPERPHDPVEDEGDAGDGEKMPEVPSEAKSKKKSGANKSKEKRPSTANTSSTKNKKRKVDAGGDVKEEEPTVATTETVPEANDTPVEVAEEKKNPIEKNDGDVKKDADGKTEKPNDKKSEQTEGEKRLKKEQKALEKERLKQELKEKKLEKKRKQRIEQLKNQEVTTTTLTDLDIEIMQSLNVESLDIPRCLNAMSKLDLIQVSQDILVQYPNILTTIKKCRKFKADPTVRQKADYLFNKFKTLFVVGVNESTQKLLDLQSEASQDSASSGHSPVRDGDQAKDAAARVQAVATTSDVSKSSEMPKLTNIEEARQAAEETVASLVKSLEGSSAVVDGESSEPKATEES